MSKLRTILRKICHFFPYPLPRDSDAFQKFSDDILETHGFPKIESYYHSIAVMIQHLPPTMVFKSKNWFAFSLKNAQAREVAYYKIKEIQEKQREREKTEDKPQ